MNQFNDFSIQDEYMEDPYDLDRSMEEQLERIPEVNELLQDKDQEALNSSFRSNGSSGRSDFKFGLSGSNNLGASIFRNINENGLFGLHKNSYCKLSLLEDDIDIEATQFARLTPCLKDKNMQCLNGIAQKMNSQTKPAYSERSCMSNKGDSRENSLNRATKYDSNWKDWPSEELEGMEPNKDSEKDQTAADSQSVASKPSSSSNGASKLQIPKVIWNFSLPSAQEKAASKAEGDYKMKNGALNDDFSYNVAYLKEKQPKHEITPSTTGNVVVGGATFCENVKKIEMARDMDSTDDDFMVGRLTKAERAAKVKKYLEKKRRRKWDKQVNYQSRKKVADKRPRYKGRFLSTEQAIELSEELKMDQNRKLEKSKVFLTEIINKKTGKVIKRIFPTEEALRKYTSPNLV